MNFQQLHYIVAVAQYGSFSRAAEHCNITQATLSTMIKRAEEELSVVIFDRKMNPIITTECGSEIVAQAKKVLNEYQTLTYIADQTNHTIKGTFKLGVIPTVASTLVPQIINPIDQKYPDLYLTIKEITTQNIIKQLIEGDLDAGILATPLERENIEEDVLYYETLQVYGSRGEQKEYVMPEELKNEKVWLLEEGHCLRDQVIQYCGLKKNSKKHNKIEFEANSFESLLNLADIYGGLTLIPELYAQSLTGSRKEKVMNFKKPYPVREISIVYNRPYAKQRIISALAQTIKEVMNPKLMWKKIKNSEMVIVQM